MELISFENKEIRKIWHNDEWYFSVIDVVGVLTESVEPRNYWATLKKREPQLLTVCQQLKLEATDGRKRSTDCSNTEGVLRIIMSIPSPKAEPFKLWLAEQGKRTIDEINNPELLTERQAEYYRLKGYPEEWIAQRMENIKIRKELTDEWQKRGIEQDKEFSILTATISKGTFGITPSDHAKIKDVDPKKLRDNMTTLELLLTSLGEEVTRTIAVNNDAKGFFENQQAAEKGGKIAGEARERVEIGTGQKVVSSQNFKHLKGDSQPLKSEDEDKTSND